MSLVCKDCEGHNKPKTIEFGKDEFDKKTIIVVTHLDGSKTEQRVTDWLKSLNTNCRGGT